MNDRRFEEIEVEIDKPGLEELGWYVDDVRARLVVTPGGSFSHELALSGALRFFPEDWSDRFTDSRGNGKPPPLVARISRATSTAPTVLVEIDLDRDINRVEKGIARFAEKSWSWSAAQAEDVRQIKISLTAFDFVEDLESRPSVPAGAVTSLPVEFVDEGTREALRMRAVSAQAQIRDREVHVVVEGTCGFAGAEELLSTMLADSGREPGERTAADESPFKVNVPAFEVEILDESGFILDRHGEEFSWPRAFIPVAKGAKVPGREPRWAFQHSKGVGDLPGVPARVVVRFVDPNVS